MGAPLQPPCRPFCCFPYDDSTLCRPRGNGEAFPTAFLPPAAHERALGLPPEPRELTGRRSIDLRNA